MSRKVKVRIDNMIYDGGFITCFVKYEDQSNILIYNPVDYHFFSIPPYDRKIMRAVCHTLEQFISQVTKDYQKLGDTEIEIEI